MAATQPGLGALAADDVRKDDARVIGIESDRRSDLVVFESAEPPSDRALALAEDLFVIVGDAPSASNPATVAARLFDAARWQAAAEVARSFGARVGATTGVRVIARVRSERDFKRTELRAAVIDAVLRWRPRWRVRDPAELEIWVLETRRGHFRAAMRLSSADMRSRGGRAVERAGAALRPSIAAPLVRGQGHRPASCSTRSAGSGTVLREARRMGWNVFGTDIDDEAVLAARENVPGADVVAADATRLPLADGAAGAVVTNAPFGVQHVPQTGGLELGAWWQAVLAEFARVVRPGGTVVVLHPEDRRLSDAVRANPDLRDQGHAPIRTLGQDASIRTLRRR